MGVYLSRTGIQATREIGHAQFKNEVSLWLPCFPSFAGGPGVGQRGTNYRTTIGQL
jgi:hypothetical protein